MIRVLLISISFFLLFLSCSNPPVATPGIQLNNVVTGIYVTGLTPDLIAVWGNPSSDEDGLQQPKTVNKNIGASDIPTEFTLGLPYPNPFKASTTVNFSLPSPAKVNLWIETAYLPESATPYPSQNQSGNQFIRVYILKNRAISAGTHAYSFGSILSVEGEEIERVPPGFYRVFLQAGSFFRYHDIYIADDKIQAPLGLQKFIFDI